MKKLLIVVLSLSLVIPAQKLEAAVSNKVAFALGVLAGAVLMKVTLDLNSEAKEARKERMEQEIFEEVRKRNPRS